MRRLRSRLPRPPRRRSEQQPRPRRRRARVGARGPRTVWTRSLPSPVSAGPSSRRSGPIFPESTDLRQVWAFDNAAMPRLDVLLAERGLAESRSRAQALVMAGRVTVDGDVVTKAGTAVADDAVLAVSEPPR